MAIGNWKLWLPCVVIWIKFAFCRWYSVVEPYQRSSVVTRGIIANTGQSVGHQKGCPCYTIEFSFRQSKVLLASSIESRRGLPLVGIVGIVHVWVATVGKIASLHLHPSLDLRGRRTGCSGSCLPTFTGLTTVFGHLVAF